jgi:HEPN domain-containing protein
MTKDKNDYLRNWLLLANEDISVIDSLFREDPDFYARTICYHAQQAIEKFLKSFLVFNNKDFPRTHDLEFLLLECKKIEKSGFDFDFGSLTDFGVSVRYPDDFIIPDKEETILYRDLAKGVKKEVESKIKI